MKKIICALLALTMLLCFAACSSDKNGKTADTAETQQKAELTPEITLKPETWVNVINEIYANPQNYAGKVISLDGLYSYEDAGNGNRYYYVYRQGPGCCGNDGSMCGFEFTAGNGSQYPDYTYNPSDSLEKHPWISVTGVLSTYEENGKTFLTLSDSNVKLLPDSQRGNPVVTN